MADEATLIIKAETDQLVTAETRLNKVNKAGKETAKVQKQVGGSFGNVGNSVRNAAFQFQDLAVQIEAGVSPARALSQQIPQLLGGFGAVGAVTGLVAGLAFAIGGKSVDSLYNTLFASANAANVLDDALKELDDTIKITKDGTILLSEEFEILAKKSRDVAEVQLRARLISATNAANAAFNELSNNVDDFNTTLAATSRSITARKAAISELSREYGLNSNQVKELAELTRTAVSSRSLTDIQALRDRVSELAISSGSVTEKFTLFAQAVNESASSSEQAAAISELLTSAINDQDAAIAKSGETTVEALAKQAEERQKLLLSVEEDERRLTLFFQREEEKRLELAEREARKREKIEQRNVAIKEAQRARDIQNAESFTQKTLSILEKGAKEGSALAKAAFVANQAITIAKMIVDTEAAATAALAAGGPFAGPALSAVIRGLGYASVGVVAGQTIASVSGGRAQGGQVRPGEAYRVGEFGPETFVPNSAGRIVPNGAANDSGMPVEVINNIRVIGGNSDAQVTTSTTRQNDRKVVQDIVVDLMANQSSPARQALHRTSNVVPRGSR